MSHEVAKRVGKDEVIQIDLPATLDADTSRTIFAVFVGDVKPKRPNLHPLTLVVGSKPGHKDVLSVPFAGVPPGTYKVFIQRADLTPDGMQVQAPVFVERVEVSALLAARNGAVN